jgi:hypothetical protein
LPLSLAKRTAQPETFQGFGIGSSQRHCLNKKLESTIAQAKSTPTRVNTRNSLIPRGKTRVKF